MSDSVYFDFWTNIPPQGTERESTRAHYLVMVTTKDPVSGQERDEKELKRIANDFLTLALGKDVTERLDLKKISEAEAVSLTKIHSAGTHHDGAVWLVE